MIRKGHFNFSAVVLQYALAAHAGIEARVHCAVNKVFFTVGKFFQVFYAFLNLQLTGAAGAYTATVMVLFIMVLQANFQQALSGLYVF